MSVPRLRKRQSSLAILVEQERSKAAPDRDEEDLISEADEVSHQDERSVAAAEQPEVTSEGGDTDVAESSEDESNLQPVAAKVKSVQRKGKFSKKGHDKIRDTEVEIPSPLRASSRLKSMIRRGKYKPELLRDMTVEFEFYAGDFLTVRGEGEDFYLCRVLEDVMASNDLGWFKVSWYNRVSDNTYEASYDDECHIDAVITRVKIEEKEAGKFSLPKHHIKQTKKLLREALAQERGEELFEEEENEEDFEEDAEEDEEKEEEEEEEPPAKRTRSSRGQSTPKKTSPRKGKKKSSPSPRKRKSTAKPREKKKKEKPDRPRRPGVLIPNDSIELYDKDPTFETREGISLLPCKWSIRAVLLNDMKMLKEAIDNVKEVHSVHWPRSPDVGWPASAYALVSGNKEAIKLLMEDSRKPKNNRCSAPETSLHRMDTGTYNFHTFGHAVRDLTASRGSKEGNNAFLGDIDNTIDPLKDDLWEFCFQNDVSLEIINFILKDLKPSSDEDEQYVNEEEAIQHIYQAVRAGNRTLAGHFVRKAIERDGFGFNFLHKEVLVNNTEPLSKFRAASVTKKLYGNKNVSPLHCACINPNVKYLQQLLETAPSATYIKDDEGYQIMHYAAACEGPGPLNLLLSKGIDPDMGATRGNITPLIIAAKYGRDENVKALLGFGDDEEDEDEAMETEEKQGKPKANINIKTKNGQTALHFAAENGHESTVRLLARCGMNVDALTGTKFGNVSPLMLAAIKGHLGVVKTLVELGASADKQGKWKKTALMYAVKNGHSPIAAYLLRIGVDENAADTSRNTPAHYAAAFGWLHCLQLLIQAKADPNMANTWKVTPLGIAMMKNNFQCAEYLLSLESVDVNYTDDLGRTLLSQTISNSSLEGDIVEKIIFLVEKKGADVNRPDMKDWTPLHHLSSKSVFSRDQYYHQEFQCRTPPALEKGMSDACSKITNVLLKNGADPNAVDKEGITPIMMALLQNNFPLIKLLLENGARVSVGRDTQGKQILHYMAGRRTLLDLRILYPEDCVPTLEGGRHEREQKLNNFFEKQVKRANAETMELLVQGDGDINCQANNGLTPLMLALSECNLEQVSLLLTHGADATIGVENTGRNALHLLASRCLVVGTVDYLLSIASKADGDKMRVLVNAVDNNGFTPFLQACETYGSACDYEKVDKARNAKNFIKILIDQLGADVSARVGKKNKSKEAVIRSVETFGLSFTRDGSKTKNTKLKPVCMDTESDSSGEEENDEEEEKEEEEEMEFDDEQSKDDDADDDNVDDDDFIDDDELTSNAKQAAKPGEGQGAELQNEYGVTGTFSCLHFLCFKREKEDVEEGTESCLQILLTRVKDVKLINSRDLHGRSPLHIAVLWNNLGAVKELISAGANVNILSDNKSDALSPPVVLASMKPCKPEILVELLKAGADPNIPNGKYSACALAYAVTNSPDSVSTPLKITSALLNAGADVNATDFNKRSALHYAVNTTTGGYEAMTEVEDLLTKHSADCAAVDIRGRIPLHYAFVKMERHTDTSLADPMSVVSLLCDAMVEQGLDTKKLINRQDKFGQTPFHRLALRGATICGLNLIQKGALFDIKDNHGNTPYGLAIREGHDGCAMMFSQMKAPPSTTIITPVTEVQKKQYEKEKKESIWKYKGSVNLVEPRPIIKSAFRAVVENNWQGIAYLMLEVMGLDFVEAIQATLEAEKFDLVWTLLRKQRHDSNLQGLDSHQHNLLHLLAIHSKGSYITTKIAMHLLQHGVSASALDAQGAIPLHYAACNGNQELCELLLDNEPSSLDVSDKDNVSPFAAVFSGANGDMSQRFRLVKFFVEAGPKTLDVCYRIADWNETTTPLLEAVLAGDQKLVAYLIGNGASVNFAKKDGKTPIMDAVVLECEDMVKILLYGTDDRLKWNEPAKTDVNLAAQDENGNSVVHHCIKTREYGSSENVSMLQLLAKFNAPLTLKNKEGHTPLYIAKTQASGVMKNVLLELLRKEQIAQDCEEPVETDTGFTFTTSLDKFFEGPPPDFDADAAAMMEQAREEDEPYEEQPVPVDSSFGMQGIGEVYVDPDTKIPYDILMTKVDVKWGMWGLNNFYKMQVVYQKGKNLWILFNRWGRIEDSGQHQRTPFSDPKEATAEFRKIFKSKSGNEWENKDRFQKMPKKYQLVLPELNPERMRKPLKDVLKPFDLEKCKPSRLPEELQTFMKMLVNVSTMRNAVRNSGLDVDQNYMPFGRMGQETIDKAREILNKIKNQLEGVHSNIKETPDAEDRFSKIAELSNEFYMLIPVSNYRFERIRPLNEMRDVERYLDALHKLSELAFVSKVLLGAQYRCKEVSPLDYCFRALGCKLELMDPASDECQLLLQYVQNSGDNCNITVEGIYRVTRPGEDERLAQSGVDTNHRLLWHGTRVSNMMGILNQGLRIGPPEAPTTGWSYGKGVYTSDSLAKSLNYCCLYDSGNEGFLLLCQVALGKMHECSSCEYMTSPPEGYNSTWAITNVIPDPKDDVTTPYGAVVPCGRHVTNKAITEKFKDVYFFYCQENEYIVYDESQVRLRYIVRFKQ